MKTRVAIAYSFHDRDWNGGRNYFGSLFRAVAAAGEADIQFVLVTGRHTVTSLPEEFPQLEVIRTPLLDRMHPLWLARQVTLRLRDTDPLLAQFLRRHEIDILSHSGQLGRRRGAPKTLDWLYDFQFMHLPEYWQEKHLRWARKRYRAACRNCDALLVSSNDALGDLMKFAPWSTVPKRVLQFVSNPVDYGKLPSLASLRAKYAIPDDYFHLPNQFWTNKNHRLVIDALRLLRQRSFEPVVVCTGKTFDGRRPEYFAELMDHCASSGVSGQFRTLGVVPYQDTQALMAHSRAVVNPSRFEGWSTTVEEAKTMGKVLLLSDIKVHREQSPSQGRFFAVNDAVTLGELMQQCLTEPATPIDISAQQADYQARLRQFGSNYLTIVRTLAA
jgi:glycosyltransferase involved in cell wall biosynthesis